MKLGVLLPSRGLIHSRTVEELLANLNVFPGDYAVFISHDLPIPDAFNSLVERALNWGADRLLIVEEDMNLPLGIINELVASKADIVSVDYLVTPTERCARYDNDELIYVGTGLTLIKRVVFETLGSPYFRTGFDYLLPDYREHQLAEWNEGYGRQDVDFSIRARRAGFTIEVIGEVGHYKVEQLGEKHKNKGVHQIVKWLPSPS